MSSGSRILSVIVDLLGRALSGRSGGGQQARPRRRATLRPDRSRLTPEEDSSAGRMPGVETVQVDPERVGGVSVGYSPSRNHLPDSGEIIWTWVPYAENDGRGKDRPVLVIGRHGSDRVYAVRMTSRAHERDRDFISIGSGAWDAQGRESWVDIEQLYSVHHDGMRREAAVLDVARYGRIARALVDRYGWARV